MYVTTRHLNMDVIAIHYTIAVLHHIQTILQAKLLKKGNI